jgi:hypothetical protein
MGGSRTWWIGAGTALVLIACAGSTIFVTPSPVEIPTVLPSVASPSIVLTPSPSPLITVAPTASPTVSPPPTPTPTAASTKTPRPTASPFTLTLEEQLVLHSYFGVGDCAPKRTELPEHVYAAIECVVDDGLVDRVGLYAFSDLYLARDYYVQRLSEYDVTLESGDCAAGIPGDSTWNDSGHDPAESYWRSGCFLNENNHANVRMVCALNEGTFEPPGLYVGVLGSTANIAPLYDWAWGDAEWREYVLTLYEEHPDDPGLGVQPAICTYHWFER